MRSCSGRRSVRRRTQSCRSSSTSMRCVELTHTRTHTRTHNTHTKESALTSTHANTNNHRYYTSRHTHTTHTPTHTLTYTHAHPSQLHRWVCVSVSHPSTSPKERASLLSHACKLASESRKVGDWLSSTAMYVLTRRTHTHTTTHTHDDVTHSHIHNAHTHPHTHTTHTHTAHHMRSRQARRRAPTQRATGAATRRQV